MDSGHRDYLEALEVGTVIMGPGRNSEVYQKCGADVFYGIGSENDWTVAELGSRGPFSILWMPEPTWLRA